MTTRLTTLTLIAGVALFGAKAAGPKTFGTPEDARDALLRAAANGLEAVRTLFGSSSADILRTGDEVQDKGLLERFNRRATEKTQLAADAMDPNRITLLIGAEEWPFAIPLVRNNGRWFFDIQEGKLEIRRRTIGGNELNAIEICLGYVGAQRRYAETDRDGDRILEYAGKIASTQGKKDGLYWPGEDSPVAAGFAKAAAEGYAAPNSTRQAYHGYFYRILLAQGPDAVDGARDYVVRGSMIGGFAMVAWPAEYGVSGIKTFIVNQDGVVYEKDLGPRTASLAAAIAKFNPDPSWEISPEPPSD
jgi:hypothetical protein